VAIDEAATAAAFYTNPSSKPGAAVEKPQPTEHERVQNEAALQLFPTMREPAAPAAPVPENIAELRKGDFYDATATYRDVKFDAPPENATPEEKQRIHSAYDEMRRVFSDVGLSVPGATELLDLAKQHAGTPPSAETREQWRSEAVEQVKRQYGTDAQAALADAQQLAARDPRLWAFLQELGIDNHPRVVGLAIELARRQRAQGRLK